MLSWRSSDILLTSKNPERFPACVAVGEEEFAAMVLVIVIV